MAKSKKSTKKTKNWKNGGFFSGTAKTWKNFKNPKNRQKSEKSTKKKKKSENFYPFCTRIRHKKNRKISIGVPGPFLRVISDEIFVFWFFLKIFWLFIIARPSIFLPKTGGREFWQISDFQGVGLRGHFSGKKKKIDDYEKSEVKPWWSKKIFDYRLTIDPWWPWWKTSSLGFIEIIKKKNHTRPLEMNSWAQAEDITFVSLRSTQVLALRQGKTR